MSYSTLDFRFLIPRGHHCDRRVVNGIVFRTTTIFYLPTTHERRREEAVSRHRGRRDRGPVWRVERFGNQVVQMGCHSFPLILIHASPRFRITHIYIYIKGACPRFKQSLIFAFQACQLVGTKRQKSKSSSFPFREI